MVLRSIYVGYIAPLIVMMHTEKLRCYVGHFLPYRHLLTVQMYQETITVGTGGADYEVQVIRNATIDYPFRLAFKSQESFNMTVSNVTVYARQQIDWLILNRVRL